MSALKIRMLRINRGLSRDAFAEAVGVTHATVKRIEEGGLPSEATALKVADYFNEKPTDLWPALINGRSEAA